MSIAIRVRVYVEKVVVAKKRSELVHDKANRVRPDSPVSTCFWLVVVVVTRDSGETQVSPQCGGARREDGSRWSEVRCSSILLVLVVVVVVVVVVLLLL